MDTLSKEEILKFDKMGDDEIQLVLNMKRAAQRQKNRDFSEIDQILAPKPAFIDHMPDVSRKSPEGVYNDIFTSMLNDSKIGYAKSNISGAENPDLL